MLFTTVVKTESLYADGNRHNVNAVYIVAYVQSEVKSDFCAEEGIWKGKKAGRQDMPKALEEALWDKRFTR